MSMWNYMVTAHKPTNVTHSCVGNFTGSGDINLIIAKCTRIEIHTLFSHNLQQILDVPIYGRIATLELFRLDGEQQDSVFISTEEYKFCVLQWDNQTGELITRAMGDVSERTGGSLHPAANGQIGLVDPDCRVLGLHLYDGLFKIMALDSTGRFIEAFDIMLDKIVKVLDIKFLYGCSKPTIAVLYQHQPNCIYTDARHVNTYEIDVNSKDFNEKPWSLPNLDKGASMLIPIPMPFGGVLVIGEQSIVYFNHSVSKGISKPDSMAITQAYGILDGSRYLLGDQTGNLHLLAFTHENGSVTGLKVDLLGETSAASTISYLEDGFVYIGSSYGDSQLIKLDLQPDERVSNVEVVQTFVNLGPIVDFCVVEGCHEKVVTCSGGFKDGSLRILRNGIGIKVHASAKASGIKGIWSLRSSSHGLIDTFLVMSFVGQTRVLAINSNDELEETEIQGFVSNAQSLLCKDSIHDQLVQVTVDSVRLVSASSGELLSEWRDPTGLPITVATANASQVLLATRRGNLVYLEIGDGSLTKVNHLHIEFDVSCMDINSIGENPILSDLAAVGLWKDCSIRIYSLPNLDLIRSFHFPENVLPRSVLLCRFEGVSYLLCGLADGHLYNFTLNMSSGEFSEGNKISLGRKAVTLTTFRSNQTTHVFAASDRPTVIYSSNLRLMYSSVILEEVSHMCSFNFNLVSFPNSVAVVQEEDMLAIGSIDDLQKLYISSIPLGEHPYRICHQDESGTFAICSMKYSYYRRNNMIQKTVNYFVHLLDEDTFEKTSNYPLDANEEGCSILSTDGYCCVGTAYRYPDQENICSKKGRILVFAVENKRLCLVSEKETGGAVYNLNAFNGKLVAGINEKIELYKWVIREDGPRVVEYECGHPGPILAVCVKTRGDFILVGDYLKSIYLLVYKGGRLEERARDYSANWMTAVEFLDDDIYLGAESDFNIFTVRESKDCAIDNEDEPGKLEVEGQYHLGELVNQLRHGSLARSWAVSESNAIPTLIFGTANGMVGVIASLPEEQYQILEKLQMTLVKVIKGVGGLNHEQWRSFGIENNIARDPKLFLDGDLIESFLNLSRNKMDQVATAMAIPTIELCKMVQQLTILH